MTADGRPPIADELPDGWVWATLGDICEPIVQVNPRRTMPDRLIRYVDISSVDNEKNEIVGHKEVLGSDAPSRARKPIRAGDILFATVRTYLRNVAMVPSTYDGEIASTGFCVLRPSDGVQPHFIFRFLLTDKFIQRISEKQRGISYPAVIDRDVYAESIPLAPEAEQRRIVAKIETLLAQSRRGREALEAVSGLLTRFRQAVLAAAFRGELTGREPDDKPASVLLEHIRAERRRRWEERLRAQGKDPTRHKYKEPPPPDTSDLPELPEGWTYTLLEPLLSMTRRGMKTGPFGSALKKHEHRPAGVPVLGIENIGRMQFISGSKIHIAEEKADQLSEYDAQPDDVLISRSGTVGMVCVVPKGIGEARISTNLVRVTLASSSMLPEFLGFLFIGSPIVLKQVSELCKGTTRTFLNQRILSSIIFPLPPLGEQRRIVARIEALFAQADILEAQVEACRRRLEQVDQAVLARAFRGELVPQDPNDEPASVLLERMRKEREGKGEKQARQMRLPAT